MLIQTCRIAGEMIYQSSFLHVIETLFIEVKLNQTKSIILGVIYRPNSQPRADMDIFTTKLADITTKINSENKESYIMGD